MNKDENVPCRLSLNTTKKHWKELSDQRNATLKYFPHLSMNKIVLELLEDMTPEGLMLRHIITKDEYRKFKDDYVNKKIIINQKNIKLMKL